MKQLLQKNIRLIVYDFDGVMTDNRVMVSSDGVESVFCNRSDGLAVNEMRKIGIQQCIISTEANPVVKKRAEKLGIPYVQGVANKKSILINYLHENSIAQEEVAYIGNDVNDLEAMQFVGLKIAPKDAVPEVLELADIITENKGGYGVVYEVYKKFILNR